MSKPRLVIVVNDRVRMSKGKYASQAVHAALLALGVHPGVPVVVLGGSSREIARMRTTVADAGLTELRPGTLTAGTDWGDGDWSPPEEAEPSVMGTVISVRLHGGIAGRLRDLAGAHGRSVSDVVRELIYDLLDGPSRGSPMAEAQDSKP